MADRRRLFVRRNIWLLEAWNPGDPVTTGYAKATSVSERLRPASCSWGVEAGTTPTLRRRQVSSIFTKRINRSGSHELRGELNGST
jgi:hypothetical protein